MAPAFSIVVPTYNRAARAAAALRSVLAQTDGDFECLVVDDGSTDGSRRTLEAFSDPRLRFFFNESNRGQHACRNQAIREAKAPWVCFLDSDDLYLPGRLAALRKAIDARPRAGFWFTNAYVFRLGRVIGRLFEPGRPIPQGRVPGYYALGDVFLPYVTTTVCLRKEAFERFGCFREDLHILEDTQLYAQMLAGGLEVGAIGEPLAVRFLHEGQITRDYGTDFAEAALAIEASGAPPQERLRVRKRLTGEVAGYWLKSLMPEEARRLLLREWGGAARSSLLYWETFVPAPLLAAARAARRAWLSLRYGPLFAPAEFRRAGEQIRSLLAE